MTSKEKIDALKKQLILHPSYLNIIEEIEKDLKVLEILKKYMWFSFHEELGFQIFCNDKIDLGNEEEFNLLKEYLNGQ